VGLGLQVPDARTSDVTWRGDQMKTEIQFPPGGRGRSLRSPLREASHRWIGQNEYWAAMSTVTLELDPDVVSILEQDHQPAGEMARDVIIFELYRRGLLSSGKASQLLGLPRYEFIQRASHLGIPYFRFTEQELKDEFQQSESL